MKKLILFLLLPLWAMAQTSTGQEQSFPYGIVNESLQTITTPPYMTTTGMDGTQGKIPSALIEKTDNKQNSLAVDGTGTKYPTVDAVNTGLALKANLASPVLTGTPTAPTAAAGTNTTQIATMAALQAVDANVVHKTGFESISGDKTFNAAVSVVNPVNSEQTVILENGTLKLTTFDLEAQATIDASLLTTSRSHKLPDDSGTIALVETVKPYKVYTALLSQSGTNAPTATVLENTLGGTIVWTRSSTGLYNGTLTGIFTPSKTVFFINQGNGASRLSGYRPDTNTVQVVSMNAYLNEFADNSINNASIEIRVYN